MMFTLNPLKARNNLLPHHLLFQKCLVMLSLEIFFLYRTDLVVQKVH